jgi:hypothetical protein
MYISVVSFLLCITQDAQWHLGFYIMRLGECSSWTFHCSNGSSCVQHLQESFSSLLDDITEVSWPQQARHEGVLHPQWQLCKFYLKWYIRPIMPVLVSLLCMPRQSYTLMWSWMWFVANISKGYLHFMDWVWKVISFGCDITSGKQNCVEFGVVYWIHGFNTGMFLGEKTTAPIWQSINTHE